jgi:hypothetical protein
MLQLAAAAHTEIGAFWRHARGAGGNDFAKFSLGVIFLFFGKLEGNLFAGKNVIDKDHKSALPKQALATKYYLFTCCWKHGDIIGVLGQKFYGFLEKITQTISIVVKRNSFYME